MAECDVYGTVTIEGNNTVVVRDRFSGTPSLSAKNLTCSDVTEFADANENHVIDDGEVGGAIDGKGLRVDGRRARHTRS